MVPGSFNVIFFSYWVKQEFERERDLHCGNVSKLFG